ncbi:MAG TPA: hypothetical protein VGP42_17790 [Stellaceae bacterium]|nr:hypothetical protein [Stellaceae bacterium]
MNGFISNALTKIARFAVSKAAAFSYAVAVGVAGNLVFHFVQPQVPIPSILAPEASQPSDKHPNTPAATAVIGPKPAVATIPEPVSPAPSAVVWTPPPAPPPKPAAQLPDRPTASLPDPAPLPSPTWKPLQLPSVPPVPAPSEAALKPIVPASAESAAPGSASVAVLPPLAPAIEVATPPMPPESPAPKIVALPPPPPAAAEPPRGSLEFSDLWHPYRAVKKGLNWAGDQLPVIGEDHAEARPPVSPPPAVPAPIPAATAASTPPATKHGMAAEPIPLLPTKITPELADVPGSAPKPVAPGPGSGGLY